MCTRAPRPVRFQKAWKRRGSSAFSSSSSSSSKSSSKSSSDSSSSSSSSASSSISSSPPSSSPISSSISSSKPSSSLASASSERTLSPCVPFPSAPSWRELSPQATEGVSSRRALITASSKTSGVRTGATSAISPSERPCPSPLASFSTLPAEVPPPSSSSMEQPNSSASSGSLEMSGMELPRSQLLTA